MSTKKVGLRTRQTNRRAWKLRILQHISRRKRCYESMPNIARALRIGKKRLTKYLDELRAAGKVQTIWRNRATHIHVISTGYYIHCPSALDDAKLTPKQYQCLTELFKFTQISLANIGINTLTSKNTARRAVRAAERAGLLKITPQPGFCHLFQWTGKVLKAFRKRATKPFREPVPKSRRVKEVTVRKNLQTSGKASVTSDVRPKLPPWSKVLELAGVSEVAVE